jgi:D-ribose pyranase
MRKGVILNQELIAALAGLGHGHTFVVCDACYPIPDGAKKIDLALTAGVPDTPQVLQAILSEMIVEEAACCEEMEESSPGLWSLFHSLFAAQERLTPQWAKFELMAKQACFFVRTGSLELHGGIILKSASGVCGVSEKLNIPL